MRIIGLGFLVGVLLPATFFSAAPRRGPSQSPSADTPTAASDNAQSEVQVLVTIVSKGGGPVPAPSKTDFLVRADKHPVEVHDLRSVKEEPLTFSLLVDTSGSTQNTRHSQIAGAARLFKVLSKQANRGYLILFRDDVITNDKKVDAETAEKILNHGDSRRGPTALFDAVLHAASNQLTLTKNYPSTRRAIFVFSDGGDNSSRNSFEKTLNVLQGEGIPVFPIVMPSDKPHKRDLLILRALSENTGGMMVSLDERGDFAFHVLQYVDNQYLLSFSVSPAKREKFHSLEVKSVSNGIEVSAPTYYVGR
jgi:VWFA-related protein